jgi:hypothetical protein
MKKGLLAILVVVPVLGSGCGFMQNARRNVALSPLYTYTDRKEEHRNHLLAREAFRQMALQYPEHEFSCDYRKGFVDGFADFLAYGGVGEPPPMPAPKYRLFGYMTPEGLAAMEEWKRGFRHGAATAKASNLRELNTLPLHWGPVYPSEPDFRLQLENKRNKTLPPPTKVEPEPAPPPTPKTDEPANPPENPPAPPR